MNEGCGFEWHKWSQPYFLGSYPFTETNFQDFSRTQIDFSRAVQFTLTPTLQDRNVLSPYCLPYNSYFLVEFNRFPGLPRFSRICKNPVLLLKKSTAYETAYDTPYIKNTVQHTFVCSTNTVHTLTVWWRLTVITFFMQSLIIWKKQIISLVNWQYSIQP